MALQFAGRTSLIAFAVETIRGLFQQAGFEQGIHAALAAAAVLFGIGLVAGELSRRAVEEQAQAEFIEEHPEAAPGGSAPEPTPQAP